MTVTVRAVSILLDKMFKAHNFRAGPQWAPSLIVEQFGPLTYLVQVYSGDATLIIYTWPVIIPSIRMTVPMKQKSDFPSDFTPTVKPEHSEQSPAVV